MNLKQAITLCCLLTACLAGCSNKGVTMPNDTNAAAVPPGPVNIGGSAGGGGPAAAGDAGSKPGLAK
jgi:hypothetical protein